MGQASHWQVGRQQGQADLGPSLCTGHLHACRQPRKPHSSLINRFSTQVCDRSAACASRRACEAFKHLGAGGLGTSSMLDSTVASGCCPLCVHLFTSLFPSAKYIVGNNPGLLVYLVTGAGLFASDNGCLAKVHSRHTAHLFLLNQLLCVLQWIIINAHMIGHPAAPPCALVCWSNRLALLTASADSCPGFQMFMHPLYSFSYQHRPALTSRQARGSGVSAEQLQQRWS